MKGSKKILGFLLAFAMLFSVVAPVAPAFASVDDATVVTGVEKTPGTVNTWTFTTTVKELRVLPVAEQIRDKDVTITLSPGYELVGTPVITNVTPGADSVAVAGNVITWNIADVNDPAVPNTDVQETLTYTVRVTSAVPGNGRTVRPVQSIALEDRGAEATADPDPIVVPSVNRYLIQGVKEVRNVNNNVVDTGNLATNAGEGFDIKVTGPDYERTFENVANGTVANNFWVNNIVKPGTYTVSEVTAPGYITTFEPQTFEVAEGADARILNGFKVINTDDGLGNLTWNKTTDFKGEVSFDFKLKDGQGNFVSKNRISGVVGSGDLVWTLTFMDGKLLYVKDNTGFDDENDTIAIVNADTGEVKVSGLPYGAYTLVEMAKENFVPSGGTFVENADEDYYTFAPTRTLNQNNKNHTFTARVPIFNDYTAPTFDFDAEKVWTNGGPTQKPAVEFQLYQFKRNIEGHEIESKAIGSIVTLDGVVDTKNEFAPWVATFEDQPATDEVGTPYYYKVVEIGGIPDYSTSYATASKEIVVERGFGSDIVKENVTIDYLVYNRYNKPEISIPGTTPGKVVDHIRFIVGYPDNSVKPEGQLTRAEAATMFAKLLANELGETIPAATSTGFTDSENTWYTNFVAYMKDKNVITGYEDGSFKPNQTITRAEFATMVAKLINRTAIPTPFGDITGHWAQTYLEQVYGAAVVNGDPTGMFRPDDNIKRVEAASILNNVFSRGVNEAGLGTLEPSIAKFTDLNKSFWGYYAMVEATNGHTYERQAGETVLEKWLTLLDK